MSHHRHRLLRRLFMLAFFCLITYNQALAAPRNDPPPSNSGGPPTPAEQQRGAVKAMKTFVCASETVLSKPAVNITLLTYGSLHKTTKMVLAGLKSVHDQAHEREMQLVRLRDTAKAFSKIKVLKAIGIAFVPGLTTIAKKHGWIKKSTNLPGYHTWFSKWDNVWTGLTLAIGGIKLVSAGVCKETNILGAKVCKGYRGGTCSTQDDNHYGNNDLPDVSIDDEEGDSCSNNSTSNRSRFLQLLTRHRGKIQTINSATKTIGAGIERVSSPIAKAKANVEKLKQTLASVQKKMDAVKKAIGPITSVNKKISSALNKRICLPYFIKIKVKVGMSCSSHCVLVRPTFKCVKKVFGRCVMKVPNGKKCVKRSKLCKPKFKIKTKPMEFCATVKQVLEGGKVIKAVQGAMDKAIRKLLSPLTNQLMKLLPKVNFPTLPMGALTDAKNSMMSLQNIFKRYNVNVLNGYKRRLGEIQSELKRMPISSTPSSPPPSRPRTCRLNGRVVRHGQSVRVQCNTCTCRNGRLTCTKKRCTQPRSCRMGNRVIPHGRSVRVSCNTCFCRSGRLTCTKKRCTPTLTTRFRGSYARSCRSCRVRGSSICCHCRTSRGAYKYTCLARTCKQPVSNCNGSLRCSASCPKPRVCRVGNRVIPHGRSVRVSCNTCFCRSGRLTCTKKRCTPTLPTRFRGSYTRSCRSCQVKGNAICCRCRTSRGAYKYTCLARTCKQPVSNCEGTLRCSASCPRPRYCRMGSRVIPNGRSVRIKCNVCSCRGGRLTCTKRRCRPTYACGVARENRYVTLRCRTGLIRRVVFASYGMPGGACMRPRINRRCHSRLSMSRVRQRCLNRRSCRVRASNRLFRDPCRGKRKYLKIKVLCR